ncbi:MAG: hypothetical protein Q8L84_10060, partial [Hyphomonas sp.]|nr:hypothetical protein [Hyphomonas sp.]
SKGGLKAFVSKKVKFCLISFSIFLFSFSFPPYLFHSSKNYSKIGLNCFSKTSNKCFQHSIAIYSIGAFLEFKFVKKGRCLILLK